MSQNQDNASNARAATLPGSFYRDSPTGRTHRSTPSPQDAFYKQSLTPENVLKQIRRDIIMVLGFRPGANGSFSSLEERLIHAFECVVRKAMCPSLLVRQKDLYFALVCLRQHFGGETVYLTIDDVRTKVIIFDAFYRYAKDAAFCERKIWEQRYEINHSVDWEKREQARIGLVQYKKRKSECLKMYQKIVFADACHLFDSKKKRGLTLFGKDVNLDDLVKYYKAQNDPNVNSMNSRPIFLNK